jgi:sec-independent protein translocase protein TatA
MMAILFLGGLGGLSAPQGFFFIILYRSPPNILSYGGVFMHLGAGEIGLLIVLALVLFGAKRLPQVGRAAGEAIREFKAAFNGDSKLKIGEDTNTGDSEPPPNTKREGSPPDNGGSSGNRTG